MLLGEMINGQIVRSGQNEVKFTSGMRYNRFLLMKEARNWSAAGRSFVNQEASGLFEITFYPGDMYLKITE
jgi:hypothetical protein